MITTLTTKGLTARIPVEVTPDNEDKWVELLTWMANSEIPITVDSNYYNLRFVVIDKIRKAIPTELNLQFLTAEGKELFLDKHMELMWKI